MLHDITSTNMPGDVTNPFISKMTGSPSRVQSKPSLPSAPTEDVLASLREGMGRMDITSRSGSGEYIMTERKDPKESVMKGRDLDRFVPSRPSSIHHASHSSTTLPTLTKDTYSPDTSLDVSSNADLTTSSLSAALNLPPSGRRILSFRAAPPAANHATAHLDAQRNYLLHSSASSSRGTTTAGTGTQGPKKRAPPYVPERVLDAPGFADDYYLNLVDWSCANRLAIGLADVVYVWDADSGEVNGLGADSDVQNPVCSVSWSDDGAYLAVGQDSGDIEIWDVEESKRLRVMGGHGARVASLSWHGHVLSSGCRDGSIYHHDVRVAKHKVMELQGHTGEVCGLKWRPDGQLLASGGNDNVVNCWDGRIGQSILQTGDGIPRGTPKWTKRNHTAAVKALAWCPWQSSLLATGGGSADQHIHFWTTSTGARTSSLPTASQVTSLIWSPHAKELLSTHGFPNHNLILWSYPSLQKIYDVPAHDQRVLGTALSPDGCTVASAAADENLKFWRIWEAKAAKKDSGDHEAGARTKSAVRIR